MSTPAQIVDLCKRTSRSGAAGNNADQTALDLLKNLNQRCRQVWRFHDWEYSLDDILLNVTSASYDKTLAATTGEVYELGIQGQTGALKKYTRRQYLKWEKGDNAADPGTLRGYFPLGLDSNKAIILRFFSPPSDAVVVEGWGKKKLIEITTADWATEMLYFPLEAQDVIFQFLLSDAYRLMGDAKAEGQEQKAMAWLRELRGEVNSEPDDEPSEPPPDAMLFRARNRRGRGSSQVV